MEMDSSTVPCILDYLEIKPKATYHLFEPNPEFASKLRTELGYRPNVILNEFGLGDVESTLQYYPSLQTFAGGNAWEGSEDTTFPSYHLTTLDKYCAEKGIGTISLLKMDTEGFEEKILDGAAAMLPHIRYIQYEEWNNNERLIERLSPLFVCKDIGYRNTLCINKRYGI